MTNRDKSIISNLERFRVMSRDDLIVLHFKHLKDPVTQCNRTMKRLKRDGYIDVNKEYRKFIYFPSKGIKKNSTKIPHFLAIVNFYTEIIKYEEPKEFIVEPKYGKEYMEPDVFMIWKGTPFYIEIQRNVYSKKIMSAKINRYEKYFYSEVWEKERWQPDGEKKVFPIIWLISDHKYNLETTFKVIQTKNVNGIFQS
ncbi:replication-relaxation family protein [Chengkuizengella marina]|uniref:Replication-relaxation n=1 Tax=Chengkuizengella marina TaxID=2507566 RepID=A0A6N9Q073_9BACL|nr:replication-relaxation family protein [Chengkuizengella marina]NBI28083.1 hypothetical protein [Chengkuizengella marina]